MKNDNDFKKITLEELAQMMASGFASMATKDDIEKLDNRLNGFENRLDDIAVKLAPMEQLTKLLTQNVLERLSAVENKVLH